jgi:hypothetical protein
MKATHRLIYRGEVFDRKIWDKVTVKREKKRETEREGERDMKEKENRKRVKGTKSQGVMNSMYHILTYISGFQGSQAVLVHMSRRIDTYDQS